MGSDKNDGKHQCAEWNRKRRGSAALAFLSLRWGTRVNSSLQVCHGTCPLCHLEEISCTDKKARKNCVALLEKWNHWSPPMSVLPTDGLAQQKNKKPKLLVSIRLKTPVSKLKSIEFGLLMGLSIGCMIHIGPLFLGVCFFHIYESVLFAICYWRRQEYGVY